MIPMPAQPLSVPARLRAAADARVGLLQASAGGGRRHKAAVSAAFGPLRTALGVDCIAISAWDPVALQHRTLVDLGYPAGAMAACDSLLHTDPIFWRIHDLKQPVRASDVSPDLLAGPVGEGVIGAFGFGDGLTHCLFAPDGRYVGVVHMSTLPANGVDDVSVGIVDLLATDLARSVDPIAADSSRSRFGAGDEAFVVDSAREVYPLTPRADASILDRAVHTADAVYSVTQGTDAIGWRALVVDGPDLLTVRVEAIAGGALVVIRPTIAPFGLTLRELEVLDGIAAGLTNSGIGERLGLAPSTVATHVERVLVKTGRPTRAAAATLAALLRLERTHPVR